MELQDKYKLAYQKILESKKVLLVTHERPDGDALASVCSLSLLFERLGKNYFIYCHEKPAPFFNFIPNVEKISDENNFDLTGFDLIIILDCGSISRTRLEKELTSADSSKYLIEFDHHPKTDDYTDLEIRLPNMSSTAEIIFHFFKTNEINFSRDIATCILSGILTDTINFLNPCTTAETIAIASEMLSEGARMPRINRFAWKNKNIDSMKMLGQILDGLLINKKYSVAFICLKYEQLKKFGETEETFDSVMNFLSNIDDVRAVILIREEKPGQLKGSLRSNHPKIDVSLLAKYLGGGGHPKASGFKLQGNIIKSKNSWKVL